MNSCKTRNRRWPKKPTQPKREPEAWAFCVYGYSVRASTRDLVFRNQPVKVALIGSILQNSELFKLFLSKGFGNGSGHLAFIMQNIFLVEL